MPFLKSEDTGMEVFPMVNNFDGTDWVDITAFLNDADARARFRAAVSAIPGHRQISRPDDRL